MTATFFAVIFSVQGTCVWTRVTTFDASSLQVEPLETQLTDSR